MLDTRVLQRLCLQRMMWVEVVRARHTNIVKVMFAEDHVSGGG